MARLSVDAGLKLKGDPSEGVGEGRGVTILDSGTGGYDIEGAGAKRNIALDAVIVQVATKEGISRLTPQLQEAAEAAYNEEETIMQAQTAPGDTMIVARMETRRQ